MGTGWRAVAMVGVAVLAPTGCGPAVVSGDGDGDGGGGSSGQATTSGATGGGASLSGPSGSSAGPDGSGTTSSGGDSTTATSTGVDACEDLCDGSIWECRDGVDNDGDGRVDTDDPDCPTPCDDDESAFWHGLPGDYWDCRLDCFVDGNSGQADDMCDADVRCDPLGDFDDVGCAPHLDPSVCSEETQNRMCVQTCLPSVPPGCDCFGCCEVRTDEGTTTIQINLPDSCGSETLGECKPCTIDASCFKPCDPENCEWCFLADNPPENCDELACPDGSPHCGSADCPACSHCLYGCCVPSPPLL